MSFNVPLQSTKSYLYSAHKSTVELFTQISVKYDLLHKTSINISALLHYNSSTPTGYGGNLQNYQKCLFNNSWSCLKMHLHPNDTAINLYYYKSRSYEINLNVSAIIHHHEESSFDYIQFCLLGSPWRGFSRSQNCITVIIYGWTHRWIQYVRGPQIWWSWELYSVEETSRAIQRMCW